MCSKSANKIFPTHVNMKMHRSIRFIARTGHYRKSSLEHGLNFIQTLNRNVSRNFTSYKEFVLHFDRGKCSVSLKGAAFALLTAP